MSRRHGPGSPGWQAFLRNHTAHIAGVDLFVVPTIGFKLLYGLVILRPERRRLVWTDVTAIQPPSCRPPGRIPLSPFEIYSTMICPYIHGCGVQM
jgi:hypothetical protein